MNDKAQQLLESAHRELNRRKVKKAIKLISKAIELDPDSHELLRERAAMAISPLRDFKGAVEDLNLAIEMAPGVGDSYDMRGQALWYLREYEQAFRDFNKAIEVDPRCASAHYHRANFFEKLEQYEPAIEDMAWAAGLEPDNRNYKRRLEEIQHTTILHFEGLGEEPPAIALAEHPVPEAELNAARPAVAEGPEPQAPPEAVEIEEEPEPEESETELTTSEQESPPESAATSTPAPPPPPLPATEAPPAEPARNGEAVPDVLEVAQSWSVRIPTGEEFGPVSLGLLKLWAAEQRVKPGDDVRGPDGGWVAASGVAELAAVFEDLRTLRKPPVRTD